MIVLKIGGNMLRHLTDDFYDFLKKKQKQGEDILIVHGGGNLISQCGAFIGEPTEKINGIRVTNKHMMNVIEVILNQVIQRQLWMKLTQHGISSVALNQFINPLLRGTYLNQSKYGEVGNVTNLDQAWLHKAMGSNIGIMSSIAYNDFNCPLNVNADMAACKVAILLGARQLILLTDVEGVQVNHHLIKHLSYSMAHKLVYAKQIINGMIPKVQSGFNALENGVENVYITDNLTHLGTKFIK